MSTHGNMESKPKFTFVRGFVNCVFFVCSGKNALEELISFKCGVDGELISSKNHSCVNTHWEESC